MLPLARADLSSVEAVFTDVDGTLTTAGRLRASTLAAIEALVMAGVKVVLVEPGLITTDFAKTAVASVDSGATGASGDEGPYARFNKSVRKGTADVYDGPMAKLGGPPEVVAKVVAKALSSSRPRARYTVTPSAKLAIAQRAVTPDRLWDLSMRAQFPVPGKD